MTITLESVVVQDPNLVQTELDEHKMLMSIEAGKFYSLNPWASRIWEILEKPAHIRELCETLVAEYEIASQDCQEEVLQFLRALVERRLVQVQS